MRPLMRLRSRLGLVMLVLLSIELQLLGGPQGPSDRGGPRDATQSSSQNSNQRRAQAEWARPILATAEEIDAQPDRYDRQLVRVRALVGSSLGRHAFTLDDDGWFASDVLVLIPVLSPYAMAQGDMDALEGKPVTVVGRVERFYPRKFAQEYDWFRIHLFRDPDQMQPWEGRPAIVAQSVFPGPGRELVEASVDPSEAAAGPNRPLIFRVPPENRAITKLTTLLRANDPQRLVQLRVVLDGVQVQKVLNGRWILVGNSPEEQLLVQLPRSAERVHMGQSIYLLGVVREMPSSVSTLGLNTSQLSQAERTAIYVEAGYMEGT